VDNKNQLTNAYIFCPYGNHDATYDANGNLSMLNIDSAAFINTYFYDDENRLVLWLQTQSGTPLNPWDSRQNGWDLRTEFVYDGLGRLRQQLNYTSDSFNWILASATLYIYDGMRVIQERDAYNTPTVSYTRGMDLGGSLEGAGGIGGLLARSDGYSGGGWTDHNYYFADGNGNVTYMLDGSQAMVASYRYDPFGNTISSSGTISDANVYRFSSKETHVGSGMYYYGYRFYDPLMHRWINRDLVERQSGKITKKKLRAQMLAGWNLFEFCFNDSVNQSDNNGMWSIKHVISEVGRFVGQGGTCCNSSGRDEWWLDNGVWKPLPPGACTGFTDDCDGQMCNQAFNSVSFGGNSTCNPDGTFCIRMPVAPAPPGAGGAPSLPPYITVPGWTPGTIGTTIEQRSPSYPPGYAPPM
jgi:RHS repeat-associated protein